MRVVATMIALAGCGGDHAATVDAAPPDAFAACTATWTGNFAETVTTATPCSAMSGTTLAIQAPTTRLATALPISIALPAAIAGTYTSDTIGSWSALESMTIVGDTCIFEAGSALAPHGDFTLTLADAAAPHGSLALDMVVLAEEFSVCGSPLTETLELTF
ncbi:MAG TPA: hypothetical protein VGG28_09425 [Kofleriaceae bacterium]|jgi:hypothetical protein